MYSIKKRVFQLVVLLMAISVVGCGNGTKKNPIISGVKGPHVNFIDNKFTLSVVLEKVQIDYGLRLPIPKMPNSYMEVGPDFQSNGYLVNIGLDSRDIVALSNGSLQALDPKTLPGGRPLPGVSDGELPGFSIEVPRLNDMAFYMGPNVFGVFIPVPLPFKDIAGTYRFYDASGTRIGNISVVGTDANSKNSGVLLLINLQGKVAKLMSM